MLSQGPQPELKGWEALPGLPQEQLQRLSLQPGQPLHDRSHLPPGVLLIQQGQMRLLGVDQRKESFTLQRFGSGDLVGAELLLRGVPGLSLTAASEVEGSLLPAEAFFQLLDQQPELLNSLPNCCHGSCLRSQPAAMTPAIPRPKSCCSGPKTPVSSVKTPFICSAADAAMSSPSAVVAG